MKLKSLSMVFAGCAAMGAVAGAAVPASAWSVRQNASFCMTQSTQVQHDGGGVSNLTAVAAPLACPVIDTSATPKTGATALSIQVHDNSTTAAVRAAACIQLSGIAGGNCGAITSTSVAGTGLSNLSPSRAFWTGANDWPYLLVELPAVSGGLRSTIFGYTISG